MENKAMLVLDSQSALGEGPLWDHKKKILYWVDIIGAKLHIHDPEKNDNHTIQFDQFISTVVPEQPGQLILAMQHGLYRYNIALNRLTKICNPEEDKVSNRFNDGKCDSKGRFWAGTMDLDGKKDCGSLYRFDTDGRITKVLSPVSISNGIAWSPDKKFMYFIDTPTNKVSTYNYEETTGNISYHGTGAEIPVEMGSPDGMTIDAEGMIWVAHWGGAMVSRWDPYSSKLLDTIQIAAKNVTSCTFGGENLDELFITTARDGLNEDDLAAYPQSGGLFKVKASVKGLPANHYGSQ
jgi:sugar lactone lactonase YvrE